jgi:membrane protease subunit HflC
VKRLITTLVIIAIVIIVFFMIGPFFVLEEGEQAVVLRFGEIIRNVQDPGLHFKTPVVDDVRKYSSKVLSWDADPRRIPTEENQFIWVDTTARWRIEDPVEFYSTVTTLQGAYSRLDDVIESAVRTVITQNPLHEAVRSSNLINEVDREQRIQQRTQEQIGEEGLKELAQLIETQREQEAVKRGRDQLMQNIYENANQVTPQFGIELIDVVIRQIRYADQLTESVYDRMVSERQRIAQAYRSYGQGRKQDILGQLQREKQTVLSEARRRAEEIRGEADAEAAQIYANSYGQNEEFFQFWRAIQSYESSLPQMSKILTTDLQYFNYLYSEQGQ